jgi:Zn-dependent protease with chaperone function
VTTPSAAPTATAASCPACGSSLTDDPRFVRWCQACGWNAHPGAAAAKSRGDRLQRRFNRATEERLFRRVTEDGGRSPVDGATVLTYVLAGLVHLVTAAMVGCAVVALSVPHVLVRCLGLVLLLVAYCLRPRLGPSRKALKRKRYLDADAAPALHALARRVATELATDPPALIAVNDRFNASYTRVGLRRRVLVTLGLPLWETLTPAQRVALLGHELGHGANGDTRRGVWVGSALGALREWYLMLQPGGRRFGSPRGDVSGLVALSEKVAQLLLAVFSEAALLVYRLLGRLTALSGRRAEYLADAMAARVAGRDDAAGMLETLMLGGATQHVRSRYLFRTRSLRRPRRGDAGEQPPLPDYWAELRAYIASIPQSERARRRLMSQLDDSAVDSTHPPTHLRLAYVEQLPATGSAIVLSATEADAIDAEFGPIRAAFVRDMS